MRNHLNLFEVSDHFSDKYDRLRVLLVPISAEAVGKHLLPSKANVWSAVPRRIYSVKLSNEGVRDTEKFPSIQTVSTTETNITPQENSNIVSANIPKIHLKPSTETLFKLVSSNKGRLYKYDEDDWPVHAANTDEHDHVYEDFVLDTIGNAETTSRNESSMLNLSSIKSFEAQEHVSTHRKESKMSPAKESYREEQKQSLKKNSASQEDILNKLVKQPRVVLSDYFGNCNSYSPQTTKPFGILSVTEVKKSFCKKENSLKRPRCCKEEQRKKNVKRRRVEEDIQSQTIQRRNVTSRRRQKKFSEYRPSPEYLEMKRKKDLWMSIENVSKEDYLAALGLFCAKAS